MGFKNNPLSHRSFVDDDKQVLVSQKDLDLLMNQAKGGGSKPSSKKQKHYSANGNGNGSSKQESAPEESELQDKVNRLKDELEEIKSQNEVKVARKKSATSFLYRPTNDFLDAIVIAGALWFAYHLFFKSKKTQEEVGGAEKAGEAVAEAGAESEIAVDGAEMAELGAEAI
jgi:hypothetical protein